MLEFPDATSLAVAVNVVAPPLGAGFGLKPALEVAGPAVSTTVTLSEIESLPEKPPLSVTEAVIKCVPTDSVLVENEPPLPIPPSRLHVHDKPPLRSPSSASVAVPLKSIVSSSVNEELAEGNSHSPYQRNVMPGFTFPAVGRLGCTSPPFRSDLRP